METWRVVLDSPRPWILAHCETSGCKLRVCGNLASMHMRNLECAIVVFAKLRGHFRCVGVVRVLVALSVCSSLSFFSAFVYFGDFCRGEGTQRSALFKICLHIPLWCGGVRGLTM